jgi:hypothetical protein
MAMGVDCRLLPRGRRSHVDRGVGHDPTRRNVLPLSPFVARAALSRQTGFPGQFSGWWPDKVAEALFPGAAGVCPVRCGISVIARVALRYPQKSYMFAAVTRL